MRAQIRLPRIGNRSTPRGGAKRPLIRYDLSAATALAETTGKKLMRMILLAGAALALSACGGGAEKADETNVLTADNMLMDENMSMDMNASMNMGADVNAATDANSVNMMVEDATTNDPDTNLANGI
jgi:hypothetical protein